MFLLIFEKNDRMNRGLSVDEKQKYYTLSLTKKKKIIETIADFLSLFEDIKFAFIFGSFIDGLPEESFPFHDIDVGIYLSEPDKKNTDIIPSMCPGN